MLDIIIYSGAVCPYCDRAKQLLDMKKVSYKEIKVDENPELRLEMVAKTGRRTIPQIFINGRHIGGCDDLYALDKSGELDEILNKGE